MNKHAQAMGRLGGASKSEAKLAAIRLNGHMAGACPACGARGNLWAAAGVYCHACQAPLIPLSGRRRAYQVTDADGMAAWRATGKGAA